LKLASRIIPQVKRSGISTLLAHPSLTETIFMLILKKTKLRAIK